MSYYPILKSPYCQGTTTLYNFSPNNWESVYKGKQFVNLTYIQDETWCSHSLGELMYGDSRTISHSDVVDLMSENTLPLLSLTQEKLSEHCQILPILNCNHTQVPTYRATLNLTSEWMTTSYQGEIDPFPPQASLLTFSPFLQFGKNVENYVLLMNLEKQPSNREVGVKIYDADSKVLKSTQKAMSNQVNVISLDDLGFDESSLPVVVCSEMAAIPLYFACTNRGEFLSLEHTHPPASLVIHGNRFGAQKALKEYWTSQFNT